jgi:dolichol-phosphate mannosyltransferase
VIAPKRQIKKDEVCILIPTLDEEKSIESVITDFQSLGFNNVFVMDGNSKDKTIDIAREKGAKVEIQTGKGKGLAIQQAFKMIKEEVIVTIDGDGTYLPSDVEKLLEPIQRDEADHVIGNRFADYETGAFTRLNLFGNKMLNKLFGLAYGVLLEDMLSGYRAIKKEAIRELDLNKLGFEIEAEMTIESVKKNIRMTEVPITYRPRIKSATKLRPFRDGVRIAYTLYDLLKTYNPIFYFGLFGVLFILIGTISGIYVLFDWLKGVEHIPLSIFTTLIIISGIQMFVFGLIGNLVLALQKEMMKELRKR